MPAGRWTLYRSALRKIGLREIDLQRDAFRMALFAASSNCHGKGLEWYGEVTDEIPDGNGYARGGAALPDVTWDGLTFDAGLLVWMAEGGPLVARRAVIYDATVAGAPLLAWCDMDTAGDVTVTDGNELRVRLAGIFAFAGEGD